MKLKTWMEFYNEFTCLDFGSQGCQQDWKSRPSVFQLRLCSRTFLARSRPRTSPVLCHQLAKRCTWRNGALFPKRPSVHISVDPSESIRRDELRNNKKRHFRVGYTYRHWQAAIIRCADTWWTPGTVNTTPKKDVFSRNGRPLDKNNCTTDSIENWSAACNLTIVFVKVDPIRWNIKSKYDIASYFDQHWRWILNIFLKFTNFSLKWWRAISWTDAFLDCATASGEYGLKWA